MSRVVRDWRHFGAFLLMSGALLWGGSLPEAGRIFMPPWDKLAHGAVFFVMTVLLGLGVRMPLPAMVLVVLAVGACDEWHQHFVPGRVGSTWDLLADLAGIVVAALLIFSWRRWFPARSRH